jgi:hypothetical protein
MYSIKLLSAFIPFFFVTCLKAQIVHIPDPAFKHYLINNPNINTNNDNEIQVSEAEAYTGEIFLTNFTISSLTGLEAFTSITSFYSGNNNFTTIDLSNNTALTSLHLSNNFGLTALNIENNTALTNLILVLNGFNHINLENQASLENLSLSMQNIVSLNLEDCVNLKTISISNTYITSLDLSNNPLLEEVYCNSNSINFLNLANGNNSNITHITANQNPAMCIEVDHVNHSTNNWTGSNFTFNFNQVFTEDCGIAVKIEELQQSKNLKIYPNPTQNLVQFSENVNIQVYNAVGKLVSENFQTQSFDLSNQPAGMYLFVIFDNQNNILQKQKVVKQ